MTARDLLAGLARFGTIVALLCLVSIAGGVQ